MLMAYLDDSGTHSESHNCVIGGYWGSVNEWKKFECEWKSILDSEGVEEFHAKDFWFRNPTDGSRVGAFAGWDDARHAHFIDRLLKVIESRKIYPFACGVIREAWDNQPANQKAFYTGVSRAEHRRPEFLAIQRIVIGCARYCHAGKTMHFTADEPSKKSSLKTSMDECFFDLKQGFRESGDSILEKIGEWGYADSAKARPLQAADLIAYEAHRYAKKATAANDPNLPVRKEYRRAMIRLRSMDDVWLFDQPRFSNLEKMINTAKLGG